MDQAIAGRKHAEEARRLSSAGDHENALAQLERATDANPYQSILWLVAWGDAGTQAAALEGGLTTLRHMDIEVVTVLFGLYYKETTIVYGN